MSTTNKTWTGEEFKALHPTTKFYILEHINTCDTNSYAEAIREVQKENEEQIEKLSQEIQAKLEPITKQLDELRERIHSKEESFKMTQEEAEEFYKEMLEELEKFKAENTDERCVMIQRFDSIEDVLESEHTRLRSDLTEEERLQYDKDIEEMNRLNKEHCDIWNTGPLVGNNFQSTYNKEYIDKKAKQISLEKSRQKHIFGIENTIFLSPLSEYHFYDIAHYGYQLVQIDLTNNSTVKYDNTKYRAVNFKIIDDELALEEHFDQKVLYEGIKKYPKLFKFVKDRSTKRCMECIDLNPGVLEYIENQTPEMLILALNKEYPNCNNPWRHCKIDKNTIENIDKLEIKLVTNFGLGIESVRVQSDDLIKLHINTHKSGWGIDKAKFTYDTAMLTAKLCKDAAILLADVDCVDENIILEYIDKDEYNLRCVPRKKQTFKIVMKAVSKIGLARKYVSNKSDNKCGTEYELFVFPEEQQKEIDLTSVKQNGLALEHIEEQFQNFENIYAAVQQNVEARKFIKAKLSPEEKEKINLLCIGKDLSTFTKISDTDQTFDLILQTVTKDPRYANHIKIKLSPEQYEQLDKTLITHGWEGLINIPQKRQSYDLILKAVNNSSIESFKIEKRRYILNVNFYDKNVIKIKLSPKQWETINLIVVEKNPLLLSKIIKSRQTLDVVTKAITLNSKARQYVRAVFTSEEFRSINTLCLKDDPMTLKYIPFEQQDLALIKSPLKENKNCSKFIDPDIILGLIEFSKL